MWTAVVNNCRSTLVEENDEAMRKERGRVFGFCGEEERE